MTSNQIKSHSSLWSKTMESLSSSPLYIAAATASVLLYYAALLRHWRRRRSSTGSAPLPPGPTGLPIIGNLPFIKPELHYFTRLAATYGPIYRLHFGSQIVIVVSTPSLAGEILRDQDTNFANHDFSEAAVALSFNRSDIVWNPIGPTHRMLRRICAQELLSPPKLAAVYYLRRRELRCGIARLYASAVAGEAVNVGDKVTETILSVVTSLLWGGSGDAVNQEFWELVRRASRLFGQPNVSDFFPALRRFDLQGVKRKMTELQKKLDEIFEVMIERKRGRAEAAEAAEAAEGEGKDFLDFLLKVEREGYNGKTLFTMDHVKALLMDTIVGGTETVSNTLEFTMAELLNRPETLIRAQAELDEVVGRSSIVEESHIHKLPYLSAVIKEGLRLHPPLPLLVPRCPLSSCTVGGYSVPKGSRVFVNISAIHRDPAAWKDPEVFRPERFMEAGAGRWDFTGNDFSYLPFGSGRRMCVGIPLGERNFAHCLASLLHSFDWKLREGEELDMSEKIGVVVKKTKPLVAVPVARLSDPELYSS